ncbi:MULTISPECIES: hypothetical protein [unclassified Bradyrhizobium]
MVKVTVVIRDVGRLKPDYSLDFNVPEVPKVGSYISIYRPDAPHHSEDLIVEKVWWGLDHPETEPFANGEPKTGSLREIMVECVQAIGPYSLDRWRDRLQASRERGEDVPEFEVARLSVRQDELDKK